jgi:hypothetical protein
VSSAPKTRLARTSPRRSTPHVTKLSHEICLGFWATNVAAPFHAFTLEAEMDRQAAPPLRGVFIDAPSRSHASLSDSLTLRYAETRGAASLTLCYAEMRGAASLTLCYVQRRGAASLTAPSRQRVARSLR